MDPSTTINMKDTLQVIEASSGFSDTVLLAAIAAFLAIATLIIKAVIEAQAKKAEAEAARTAKKLEEVETKIDGRLTQLLEIATKEAEERGQRIGKEVEKNDEAARKQEIASVPTILHETDATLKIKGGELKIDKGKKKQ